MQNKKPCRRRAAKRRKNKAPGASPGLQLRNDASPEGAKEVFENYFSAAAEHLCALNCC